MNGDTIKEFLVALGFKIDESSFKKFTGSIDDATVKVAKFGATVGAVAAGVFYAVSKIADSYKQLEVSSQLLNTTAKNIEQLRYVTKGMGGEAEDANSSIAALSHTINNTLMRVGNGAYMFHALGVQIKNTKGQIRDTTDVLFDIGRAIKGMNQSKQLVILENLGIAPNMLRTITQDTSDLREEFQLLYKEVGLDSNKAAKQGFLFSNSLSRLGGVLTAIYKGIGVKFIPMLTDAMDRLRKMFIINAPLIVSSITPIIAVILRVGEVLLTLAMRAFTAFAKLNEATNGWASYILAAVAAWRLLNLSFLASPVGIVLALGTAILALYDDYKTWKEGGQSLIDWSKWEPDIKAATKAIRGLGEVILGVFKSTVFLGKALWDLTDGRFHDSWEDFKQFGNSFAMDLGKGIYDIGSAANDWAMAQNGPSATGGLGQPFAGSTIHHHSLAPADTALFANMPSGTLLPPRSMSSGVTIHQKTDINVNGAGDPSTTATHVSSVQGNVNADLARNMKTAVK